MTRNHFWQKRKIFLSLTTITKGGWEKKIKEIQKFGLEEICLFLTCVGEKERRAVYRQLEKTSVRKIPLVHLRNDMKPEELAYLIKRFKTEAFNAHSAREYPFLTNLSRYQKRIYLENTKIPLVEDEIKEFAGVCLDFVHLEIDRIWRPGKYKQDIEVAKKFLCGCNHLSAMKEALYREGPEAVSHHYLSDVSDLDYLKHYPANFFSPICALELENSLEEQMEARDYLFQLLKDKNDEEQENGIIK